MHVWLLSDSDMRLVPWRHGLINDWAVVQELQQLMYTSQSYLVKRCVILLVNILALSWGITSHCWPLIIFITSITIAPDNLSIQAVLRARGDAHRHGNDFFGWRSKNWWKTIKTIKFKIYAICISRKRYIRCTMGSGPRTPETRICVLKSNLTVPKVTFNC